MLKDYTSETSPSAQEAILIRAYWRLHSIAVQAIHDLDDEHGKKYQKALADLKALAFSMAQYNGTSCDRWRDERF